MTRDGWAVVAGLMAVMGCAPSARTLQQRFAERLRPVPLQTTPPWSGPVTPLKVRVHADDGHRGAILGWQVRFYRVVERINPALKAAIGAELEVVGLQPWTRARGAGGLQAALFDLARHDPGNDVDLVIGLTTPFPEVTVSHDQLGLATLLGKHLVVRPGDDLKQFEQLERGLTRLDQEEREDLYQALRRHRAATVLLHEIGHALGALHVRDPGALMAAQQSPKHAAFTPENRRLMQIALSARGENRANSDARATMLRRYRAALSEMQQQRVDPQARALMLGLISEGPGRLTNLTQRDLQRFDPATGRPTNAAGFEDDESLANRARALAADAPEAGWALLAPVLERNPSKASIQRIGCEVSVRRAPADDATLAVCRRAVALTPREPMPMLWLAVSRQHRGQDEQALQDARAAEALLREDKAETTGGWALLAQVYRSLSAVTWAEAAVKRSGDPELQDQIRAWAAKVRNAYGLSPNAAERGVGPAEEPVYLALKGDISAAAGARDLDRLAKLEAELKRRFPKMARTSAGCRVLVAKRLWSAAWPSCRAAAKAAPKSADAQTLLAVAAFGSGRFAEAIAPLRRAIRLAPDREDAWTLLGSAYRATGQQEALARLRSRYRRRFGRDLP